MSGWQRGRWRRGEERREAGKRGSGAARWGANPHKVTLQPANPTKPSRRNPTVRDNPHTMTPTPIQTPAQYCETGHSASESSHTAPTERTYHPIQPTQAPPCERILTKSPVSPPNPAELCRTSPTVRANPHTMTSPSAHTPVRHHETRHSASQSSQSHLPPCKISEFQPPQPHTQPIQSRIGWVTKSRIGSIS
ncbi:hypothetical protein BPORC_1897 [Bifidobacterium porcinum]|nr:hypothetical protein BPORC_1897 [Bifidobacterium porcinum]